MKTTPIPDPMIEPDIFEMEDQFEMLIVDTGSFEEIIAGQKVGKNLYRIVRQPPHGKTLFLDDVVSVHPLKKKGYYWVAELKVASGNFAMILEGLHRNPSGRKIFNQLSRLGVCDPLGDGVFTMSAPRKQWPQILRILNKAQIKTIPLGDKTI